MFTRPSRHLLFWTVVAASLFATSCAHQVRTVPLPDYWPTDGWRADSPESLGVDPIGLAEMYESITAGGYLIDGVVIVKDGYLISEAYRQPFCPGQRHIIHSCTKSIVSACVGIAIESGVLAGTEMPLGELFPNADSTAWSEAKREVTLAHMLTMSTGLDTRDSYLYDWEGLTAMRRSSDWVAHALALPGTASPGARFDYSNITSFLLSAAIQQATGITTEQFAREHLFSPLGITEIRWPVSPNRISIGWGELRLLPTDLAKIGMLYLHGGKWAGDQIIPREWVDESWTTHMDAGTLQPGYGYQWWIDGEGAFMALGYRGQYLIVDPAENLVVVFVSNLPDEEFRVPENLYRHHILPALSRASASTPAATTRLQDAVAAYSHPGGARQTDAVSSSAPPADALAWSGTYNLGTNRFGMTALTVDFGLDGASATVTEHYEGRDDVYQVGLADQFAVTTADGVDIGLRGGWTSTGHLQLLYVGIGEAWWTRLQLVFDGERVEITANTVSGYNATFCGTLVKSGE